MVLKRQNLTNPENIITLLGADDLKISKDDPIASKVGSELALLYGEFITQGTVETSQARNALLPVNDVFVTIDAVADSDDGEALLGDLEKLGLQQGAVFGRVVSGQLPIASIEETAKLKSLRFARPSEAITNIGQVTSQGDAAQNSDNARSTFGLNGAGVTVGVLSDSYNVRGGAARDIAGGDLPGTGNPLGNTTPVNVLQESPQRSDLDEGRAMLQIIHDVAPGAQLAFATANGGQANFANNITKLATEAGAKVITDDVAYFAEPMFQDGIIAQAIDKVVANNGVSYFSAAGNNSRKSYESAFNPSGKFLEGLGELHNFNPGSEQADVFQSVTIPVGSRIIISFQWDSPFFSVSGGSGSQNDLDIFLLNSARTTILAGANSNNIGGDPSEVFAFTNNGSFGTTQFNLAITKSSGPSPGLLKYVVFGNATINDYNTSSGTDYGHANAAGAEAVGAAFYQQTPKFGVNPPVIEPFSSAGSVPILFDTAGNRLPKPEIRQKPGIVAPDGVNTTFFPPNGRDPEGDGFPNFFGTSAAAPDAAGVAALLRSADPTKTPAEIYSALEKTALDMDDPFTPGFDIGFDFGTGFGLIQADKAIRAIKPDLTKFTNPGFETQDFSGWQTIGDASIQTRDLGVTPTNGTSQALIANGLGTSASDSNLEAFLNLRSGAINGLGNGNATQGSAIKQTFSAVAGDTVRFDWDFLTNEDTPSSTNDDFAFYSLNSGSSGSAVQLADTKSPNFSATPVVSYGQQTGYQTVSIPITQTGNYTLGLGVVNVNDNLVNSALVVDNFQLIFG